jgi:hypothetical protein
MPISCKRASWMSVCAAFTSSSMSDVSVNKMRKSSYLFFTASLA